MQYYQFFPRLLNSVCLKFWIWLKCFFAIWCNYVFNFSRNQQRSLTERFRWNFFDSICNYLIFAKFLHINKITRTQSKFACFPIEVTVFATQLWCFSKTCCKYNFRNWFITFSFSDWFWLRSGKCIRANWFNCVFVTNFWFAKLCVNVTFL